MKIIKTFEQYSLSDKDKVIKIIKKHITGTVSLMSGFRIDHEDKFIEICSYTEGYRKKAEYVAILDENGAIIQTYYVEYDGELNYDQDSTPYDIKYEDLDIEILEKIVDFIIIGDHLMTG